MIKPRRLYHSKMSQVGLSHVELAVAIVVVGLIAFVGARILSATHADTPTTSSSVSPLDKGLVIHYNFNNLSGTTIPNIAPIVNPSQNNGNVHNGVAPLTTVTSPVTGSAALQLNHVMNTDGTTNYAASQEIDVPDGNGSPQASLKVNNFTISSWIRITDTDTNEGSWEVAEKGESYWLGVRNNNNTAGYPPSSDNQTDPHLALRCGDHVQAAPGSTKYNVVQTTSPADAIQVGPNAPWYIVTCTYDNSHLSVYINGKQVGQATATGATETNDYNLTIGGTNKPQNPPPWPTYPRQEFLGGDMAGFRLYNRALSATEVAQLAALGVIH